MNTKKIISWLLLLFGEAIIITAFILFRGTTPDNILILNMVVSSIIYGLFFVDILVPWVDFNDKSQRRIGSLGLRWFVNWFYAILTIAVMTVGNVVYELTFTTQLMIHLILLFFLTLGMLGVAFSSGKVKLVSEQETENRAGILEMKKAMQRLMDRLNEQHDIPEVITKRVNRIEENLRYLSPSNNQEASEAERSFVQIANDLTFAINDFSMNEERIESNLKKLESSYQKRKNNYSN